MLTKKVVLGIRLLIIVPFQVNYQKTKQGFVSAWNSFILKEEEEEDLYYSHRGENSILTAAKSLKNSTVWNVLMQ